MLTLDISSFLFLNSPQRELYCDQERSPNFYSFLNKCNNLNKIVNFFSFFLQENDGNNSSRETEDELSFATAASDATYVPQSRSSSFHTATHSLDLTSDLEEDHREPIVNSNNASYDSSDRSFYSAQQSIVSDLSPLSPTKVSIGHDQDNVRETETPTPIYNAGGQDASEQQVQISGNDNVSTRANRKAWSDRNYENFVAKQTIKGFL